MRNPARRFIIYDQSHCENISEHATFLEAEIELERLASLAWNLAPNLAPCGSWETCGREYVLIEAEVSGSEWLEVSREAIFDISAKGIIRHRQ